MKSKKTQSEIIGLAIIAAIMLFYIFAVRYIPNNDIGLKKEIANSQLAYNLLDAFLRTTSRDCGELSMHELVQDCAVAKKITCGILDSCNYANEQAQEIFKKTLEEWNTDYEFKASDANGKEVIYLGKKCSSDKQSRQFLMPTEKGNLIVSMSICS